MQKLWTNLQMNFSWWTIRSTASLRSTIVSFPTATTKDKLPKRETWLTSEMERASASSSLQWVRLNAFRGIVISFSRSYCCQRWTGCFRIPGGLQGERWATNQCWACYCRQQQGISMGAHGSDHNLFFSCQLRTRLLKWKSGCKHKKTEPRVRFIFRTSYFTNSTFQRPRNRRRTTNCNRLACCYSSASYSNNVVNIVYFIPICPHLLYLFRTHTLSV